MEMRAGFGKAVFYYCFQFFTCSVQVFVVLHQFQAYSQDKIKF